jgi:CheY-like chemotaxis protein
MLIDATIHKANALVIDSNANSRSLITSQLRELGLGFVRAVTRVKDARIVLENAPYDLVICDYHFEGHEESGQDLLDELRRENLLPYSTVFMMITGEATYATVAEAAEAALDGYLIKPYTLNALAERMQAARHRKRVLGPIFEAIETQEFEQAAGLCLQRFEARAEFWLFAARIGAELLLRLRRHDEAKRLYEAIIAAKTVPWAKLGVARAELEGGNLSAARAHAGEPDRRDAQPRRLARRAGPRAHGAGRHRRRAGHLPHGHRADAPAACCACSAPAR